MGFFGGDKKKAKEKEKKEETGSERRSSTQRKSRRIVTPGAKPGAGRQAKVEKRERPPSAPRALQQEGAAAPAPRPSSARTPAAAPRPPSARTPAAAPRPAAPPSRPIATVTPALDDSSELEPIIAPGKGAQPTTVDFGGGPSVGRDDGKRPIDFNATNDLDFSGGLGADRPAFSRSGEPHLRDFLVNKAKLLDETQADQAQAQAQGEGVPFDVACTGLGLISEDQLVNALTQECWVPHLKVDKYEIRKKALDTISEKDARYYSVLPVDKLGSILNLAMVNPLDVDAISDLESKTGLDIKKVVATRSEIEAGVARYYGGAIAAKEGALEIAQDRESRRVTQMLTRSAGGPAIIPEPSADAFEDGAPEIRVPLSDRGPAGGGGGEIPDIADIDDLLAGDEDVAPAIVEAITIAEDELEIEADIEMVEEPELIEMVDVIEAPDLEEASDQGPVEDALEPVAPEPAIAPPAAVEAPVAPKPPAPAAARPSPPAAKPPARPTAGTGREVATSRSTTDKRERINSQSLVPVMEEDFQHAITHGKARIFEKWVSLQTRNRILNAVVVEGELDEVLTCLYAHGEPIEV